MFKQMGSYQSYTTSAKAVYYLYIISQFAIDWILSRYTESIGVMDGPICMLDSNKNNPKNEF